MLTKRKPDLQLFLNRLTSRSVLSEREKNAVLDLPGDTMLIPEGNDFIRLRETVEHTSLILHGLIARFDRNQNGHRQITALHIRGDMPDLHTVAQPRATCALHTLSFATILRVPHSALRNAAAAHPGISQALWRDTIVDSTILAQWVLNVGRRGSRARIAHLLCEMATRYGVCQPNEVSFRLPMTYEQLADTTGLTPVHVVRTLNALKQSGTTFENGLVRIKDWTTMIEIAEFDQAYLQV